MFDYDECKKRDALVTPVSSITEVASARDARERSFKHVAQPFCRARAPIGSGPRDGKCKL